MRVILTAFVSLQHFKCHKSFQIIKLFGGLHCEMNSVLCSYVRMWYIHKTSDPRCTREKFYMKSNYRRRQNFVQLNALSRTDSPAVSATARCSCSTRFEFRNKKWRMNEWNSAVERPRAWYWSVTSKAVGPTQWCSAGCAMIEVLITSQRENNLI